MTDRIVHTKTISRVERVLKSGVTVSHGDRACIDTADSNNLTVGAVSTTLIPIGTFETSGTGDGTTTFGVQLDVEVHCAVYDNAASGSVADSDFLTTVYLASSHEVTKTSTGASAAGRAFGLSSTGQVYVIPVLAWGESL